MNNFPKVIHIKDGKLYLRLVEHVITLKPFPVESIKGKVLIHFSYDGVHKGSEVFNTIGDAVNYVLGEI